MRRCEYIASISSVFVSFVFSLRFASMHSAHIPSMCWECMPILWQSYVDIAEHFIVVCVCAWMQFKWISRDLRPNTRLASILPVFRASWLVRAISHSFRSRLVHKLAGKCLAVSFLHFMFAYCSVIVEAELESAAQPSSEIFEQLVEMAFSPIESLQCMGKCYALQILVNRVFLWVENVGL